MKAGAERTKNKAAGGGRRLSARSRARTAAILERLHARYPDIECSLLYRREPFRLLVGAILAAQCTDARVNLVTPALFARFPEVRDMAAAEQGEVEELVRSCGLFRMKAKNIVAAARYLVEAHGGEVPDEEAALLKIPGVGRKIANLILGDCFGHQAIVVDTHCARISALLGYTRSENPSVIERDLMAQIPREEWINWGHLMVTHGREICVARRPDCGRCPVASFCPSSRAAEDAQG